MPLKDSNDILNEISVRYFEQPNMASNVVQLKTFKQHQVLKSSGSQHYAAATPFTCGSQSAPVRLLQPCLADRCNALLSAIL